LRHTRGRVADAMVIDQKKTHATSVQTDSRCRQQPEYTFPEGG
jgi:hypothetical protein